MYTVGNGLKSLPNAGGKSKGFERGGNIRKGTKGGTGEKFFSYLFLVGRPPFSDAPPFLIIEALCVCAYVCMCLYHRSKPWFDLVP